MAWRCWLLNLAIASVGTQFVTGAFCEGRSSRGIGRFLALGNKMCNRSMTVGEVGWERGRLRPASAP